MERAARRGGEGRASCPHSGPEKMRMENLWGTVPGLIYLGIKTVQDISEFGARKVLGSKLGRRPLNSKVDLQNPQHAVDI